jgi:hypothetical protein
MKAIDSRTTRSLDTSESAPDLAARPAPPVTQEVLTSAQRMSGYMEKHRRSGGPPTHAIETAGDFAGESADGLSSMPPMPSLAGADPKMTPDRGAAKTERFAHGHRAQAEVASARGAAAAREMEEQQAPAAAAATAASTRPSGMRAHRSAHDAGATNAEGPTAHAHVPTLTPTQPMQRQMPPANARAQARHADTKPFTPARLQARAMKRKALGLDGRLPTRAAGKHEAAAPARREHAVVPSPALSTAAAMSPQLGHSTSVPARPASNALRAQPMDAVHDTGPQEPHAQAAATTASSTTTVSDMPARGSSQPRAPSIADDAQELAAAAPASGLASTAAPLPALASSSAPTSVPASVPVSSDLDVWDVQPVDASGQAPAPVRHAREERAAEALGAQILAQEVRLATVNTTPLESPLQEVIRKL